MPTVPALPPQPIALDVVKQIAMDIGKAVAHHIETMYPHAVHATSKNMLLSVRNTTYNQIIAALAITEEAAILERLAERKRHRREVNALRRAADDLGRQREAAPSRTVDEAMVRVHEATQRARAAEEGSDA